MQILASIQCFVKEIKDFEICEGPRWMYFLTVNKTDIFVLFFNFQTW